MKLLYLSERSSIETFGLPIICDKIIAMRNGPVLSKTLDIINIGSENKNYWSQFISDRQGHNISIKSDTNSLSNLTSNDKQILNEIWAKFGQKSQWELVDYTHTYCPEWTDPGHSTQIIKYSKLFNTIGLTSLEENTIAQSLDAQLI